MICGITSIVCIADQVLPGFNNEEYNYYQFADQTYLYDPDLRWETTITRNLGLNFGIFKNRLTGTVDVYWNTTKDLLVPSIIPNSSGYSRQMTNVGGLPIEELSFH